MSSLTNIHCRLLSTSLCHLSRTSLCHLTGARYIISQEHNYVISHEHHCVISHEHLCDCEQILYRLGQDTRLIGVMPNIAHEHVWLIESSALGFSNLTSPTDVSLRNDKNPTCIPTWDCLHHCRQSVCAWDNDCTCYILSCSRASRTCDRSGFAALQASGTTLGGTRVSGERACANALDFRDMANAVSFRPTTLEPRVDRCVCVCALWEGVKGVMVGERRVRIQK